MKGSLKRGSVGSTGRILTTYVLDDFPVHSTDQTSGETRNWQGFADQEFTWSRPVIKVIQRCLLMTTDPGDLVLDITCGSGTTAFVAEQWGRRWITCDTSRVALTLAKQRLMTAVFDYYQLAHEAEGVDSGFRYKTVPHVTLKSIANNEPPEQETLYDQPLVDNSKARVTGPFTVEAVPAPMVKSLAEISGEETAAPMPADDSVSRSGETVRQDEWRSGAAPRRDSRQGRTDDSLLPRRTSLRHALAARGRGNQAERRRPGEIARRRGD